MSKALAASTIVFLCCVSSVFAQAEVDTSALRRTIIDFDRLVKLAEEPAVPVPDEETPEERRVREEGERAAVKKSAVKLMVEATAHMRKGTKAIAAFESLLVSQVSLTNATSPWNDVQLRNWYDEIKDWGTVAGAAVAALALAQGDDGDNKAGMSAAGVGLVGVSQVVGRLFGSVGSNRLAEKAAFLDMTVQAYDDMLAHRKHLDRLVKENDDRRIPQFEKTNADVTTMYERFDREPPDNLAVQRALTQVQADLAEYETAIRELLATSDQLESLAGGYLLALTQVAGEAEEDGDEVVREEVSAVSRRLSSSKGVKKARSDLRQVIKGLAEFREKRAPAVYEFFNVSIETRNQLKNAEEVLRKTENR